MEAHTRLRLLVTVDLWGVGLMLVSTMPYYAFYIQANDCDLSVPHLRLCHQALHQGSPCHQCLVRRAMAVCVVAVRPYPFPVERKNALYWLEKDCHAYCGLAADHPDNSHDLNTHTHQHESLTLNLNYATPQRLLHKSYTKTTLGD